MSTVPFFEGSMAMTGGDVRACLAGHREYTVRYVILVICGQVERQFTENPCVISVRRVELSEGRSVM